MNPNTFLSNPSIDCIHCTGFSDSKNLFQQLINELAGKDDWIAYKSILGYKYAEIEVSTGIRVFWNDYTANNNSYLNNKLLCIIPGNYLKTLSLVSQVKLLRKLYRRFRISRLDLKVQVENPEWSIRQIYSLVKLGKDRKGTQISFRPYKSYETVPKTVSKNSNEPITLYFPRLKGAKRLMCIYDPLPVHGIANAQHWEHRLTDEYVWSSLLELLVLDGQREAIGKMIAELVFDGIDFRDSRGRAAWYKQLMTLPIAA